MVYGPGFSDFFEVGMPLTVIIYVLAILLLPRLCSDAK
jgi:hypothetical protein